MELYYNYRSEVDGQKDYLENLVHATLEHAAEIDDLIAQNARGWSLARLSKVTLATLRIGICEMLYNDEIPDSIAINEAVQLAKDYEGEKASAFVNGVLSAIYKAQKAE